MKIKRLTSKHIEPLITDLQAKRGMARDDPFCTAEVRQALQNAAVALTRAEFAIKEIENRGPVS